MDAPRYFVHKENKKIYNVLYWMKNTEGRSAFSEHHRRIMEYIGSFPPENGCFASNKCINDKTCQTSEKTFMRNLSYLIETGAVQKTKNDNGRIFRLCIPNKEAIPQRIFRANRGIASYAYIKKKEPFFCLESKEKSSIEKEQFSPEKGTFFPYIPEENKELEEKETPNPLCLEKIDPAEWVSISSLRELEGTANIGRPLNEAPSEPRDGQSFFLSSKKEQPEDKDYSDFLPATKRGKLKLPRNEKERRLSATRKIGEGHITNPIGGPDSRPRRMNPKLARDIAPTGSVTSAQLFRYLTRLYENSFGEGTLSGMLPDSKHGIMNVFDNLRQKFVDSCNFEPTNRDLAEYFEWFLDPKRLSGILHSAKYGSDKGPVHFKMLEGAAFIRRFYDEIIKRRSGTKRDAYTNPAIEKIAEQLDFVDRYFKALKTAEQEGNQDAFIVAMAGCGYALTAEYLHQEHSMDDSGCRQRIISAMSDYIKRSDDHKKAVRYLELGLQATFKNKKYLRSDCCIWYDCEQKCNDLIAIAIKQSGVHDL